MDADYFQHIPMFINAGFIMAIVGASFVLAIVICVLVSGCFSRIPVRFRQMEPGLVWLLLIPCFSLVWNFFVFPKLSKSFKSYFDSVGRHDLGDCGENIAWAYAITTACALLPCVGYLAAIGSLVLIIIYLVKAMELKAQISS